MIHSITLKDFKIPLSVERSLLDFFANNRQYGKYYTSDSGQATQLTLLGGYKKPNFISDIEKRISGNLIHNSYFVSNFGIEKHKDDNRKCVISFQLMNEDNIPLVFEIGGKQFIQFYEDGPVMFNLVLIILPSLPELKGYSFKLNYLDSLPMNIIWNVIEERNYL